MEVDQSARTNKELKGFHDDDDEATVADSAARADARGKVQRLFAHKFAPLMGADEIKVELGGGRLSRHCNRPRGY